MKAGVDRVLVVATWSTFRGRRGLVTQTAPHLLVHIDGERLPMRFGPSEVIPEHGESSHHIGGAE